MKRKPYKITSPALIAAGRAHKAALSRWHRVRSHSDPAWRAPYNDSASKHMAALILYAAALGRKQGLLPDDLGRWDAAIHDMSEGGRCVRFTLAGHAPVYVSLRFLDWKPTPAIEETA